MFRIEHGKAVYWMQAHKPTKKSKEIAGHIVSNSHGYDILMRLLRDKAQWGVVYCPAEWTAHEVAEEIIRWDPQGK